MKNLFSLIFALCFFFSTISKADLPQYVLQAENFSLNCSDYKTLEFDIKMYSTGDNGPLIYASGQYIFNFDPTIRSGGNLSLQIISSDLPSNLIPNSATISGNQLRLNTTTLPQPEDGFVIPTFPGIKIARVRLKTTSTSFSGNSFYPEWNILPSQNPVTRVYAFVNNAFTEVTASGNSYYISTSYCGMFTTSPWECCGARLVSVIAAPEGLLNTITGNLNRKDTVNVELRSDQPPYSLLGSRKCRLDSVNVSSFFPFTVSYMVHPYLVIKHHNSLETWSKNLLTLMRNGAVSTVDFTASVTSAYGDNLKQIGDKFYLFSGDVNQDDQIDINDQLTVYNDSQIPITGYLNSDLNGDNLVDLTDLNLVYNNSISFIRALTP